MELTKKIINPMKGLFFNIPIFNEKSNDKLTIYLMNAYYIT